LTNVQTVASGSAFNLALKANGTVTGWGNNAQGQTTAPVGLTNVSAIAGGTSFGLALGNQPPIASHSVVAGYIDQDLLVALPVANPDGNPLSHRIVTLPTAGQLYQNAAGSRGALIGAPNTLVSDPTGQVLFAPSLGDTGAPYANFSYAADDGLFASGIGQLTVNIGLPAAPQFTSLFWDAGTPGAESFNLDFSGSLNAAYSVWASTNFASWERLGVAVQQSPAQYQFTDTGATNWPQRYYRISAGQ
jgi:hypothetical protein